MSVEIAARLQAALEQTSDSVLREVCRRIVAEHSPADRPHSGPIGAIERFHVANYRSISSPEIDHFLASIVALCRARGMLIYSAGREGLAVSIGFNEEDAGGIMHAAVDGRFP